jgi:hypothetical protein
MSFKNGYPTINKGITEQKSPQEKILEIPTFKGLEEEKKQVGKEENLENRLINCVQWYNVMRMV